MGLKLNPITGKFDWTVSTPVSILNGGTGSSTAEFSPTQNAVTFHYYVATTGSDSNDGLTVGTPFLTVEKALNSIPLLMGRVYQVNIASGTYVLTAVYDFPHHISSYGNTDNACVIKIVGGDITDPTLTKIQGATSTTNCFVNKWRSLLVDVDGIQFDTCGSGIRAEGGRFLLRGVNVNQYKSTAILASNGGIITTDTNAFGGVLTAFTGGAATGISASGASSITFSKPTVTIQGFSISAGAISSSGASTVSMATTTLNITADAAGTRFGISANGGTVSLRNTVNISNISVSSSAGDGAIRVFAGGTISYVSGTTTNFTNCHNGFSLDAGASVTEGNTCTYNYTTTTVEVYIAHGAIVDSTNFLGATNIVYHGATFAGPLYGYDDRYTKTMLGAAGGTVGSVPFWGATGLTQDNTNFFWDDTNNRLGLGTATPAYLLDVVGTTNSKLFNSYLFSLGQVGAWTNAADAYTPRNYFNLGADWHGSAVISNNVYLVNDALFVANSHSTISGSVLKIPGNGKTNQGAFVFYTAPPASVTAGNAYTGVQRLLIASNGRIGLGTTVTPSFDLSFDNAAAKTFGIETSAAGTVGRAFTLSAGSTTTGNSNIAGGNFIIASGAGTGSAASSILFQTGTTLGSGTTLQTISTKMVILGDGKIGIGTTAPASLMANSATNTGDYSGYGVNLAGGFTWNYNGAGYGMAFTQAGSGTARNGFLVNTASTTTDSAAFTVGNPAITKGFFVVRSDGHVGMGMTTANYTDITSTFTLTQLVHTSGTARTLMITPAANTSLTLSTEVPQVEVATSTQSWATGELTSQSYIKFNAPTYAFTGASTITTPSTVTITGAPILGTNATFTNPVAFWIQDGFMLHAATAPLSNTLSAMQLNYATGGAGSLARNGLTLSLTAGSTTAGWTSAMSADNLVAGTATGYNSDTAVAGYCYRPNGNRGLNGYAHASTTGHNVGGLYCATGGAANYAVFASSTGTKSGAKNIGVFGNGLNGGGGGESHFGGLFMTMNSAAAPVWGTSAVLAADNVSDAIDIFSGRTNNTTVYTLGSTGNINANPVAVSGGQNDFIFFPGAHTAVTTEKKGFYVRGATQTITGGFATFRYSYFDAPTISAASALTVTTAATVTINGAPIADSSAIITNSLAFWIQSGTSRFDGDVTYANQATTISILDNSGTSLSFKEGANTYMIFDTRDGIENVFFNKVIYANAGIRNKVSTANVSTPPTAAELTSAFGAPATVGVGFSAIVNDNGGGTDEYSVWSDGTNWFYTIGTKAI